MKYKELWIQTRESSEAAKEQAEKVKKFCIEEQINFTETAWKGASEEYLIIRIEDRYNSEEMKKIAEYCKKRGWKNGESISKCSKNIFEAYQKAEKEFLKAKEKGTNTEKETENLLNLGLFKAFLEKQIFRRIINAYKEKEKEE